MSFEPLPPGLKSYLPYPETPWRVSPDLYTRVQGAKGSGAYQRCEVLPSDPEHAFILTYFQAAPPVNRHINAAYVIHNVPATGQFEMLIPSLEQEARSDTFAPKWHQEDNVPLRKAAVERWQKAAGQFSPVSIPNREGNKETYPLTKVLPLWHGSKQEICHAICKTGFTFFGKHHYLKDEASGAAAAKSTDLGFFGSGIYFTNSARYAADIYSDGNLLLTWVSMRSPYPVIGDKPLPAKPTDMGKLEGLHSYQNYNAHYIPVVPLNPHDSQCAVYYPCPMGMSPVWDEYVVFHKTQTLPRFWIELGVDLVRSPSTPQQPLMIEQMLDGILKLLDNPSVKQDPALHAILEKKAEALVDLDQSEPVSQEELKFYTWAKKLLDEAGKVRDVVHKQLAKLAGASPLPPPVSLVKAPFQPPPHKAAVVLPPPVLPQAAAVKSPAPSLPAAAFGALKWEQCFGLKVMQPPLPPDIETILASPCPFFPGRRVSETHLLTLIPEGMTLERLESLVHNPRQGNKIKFNYKNITTWEEYGQTPSGKTHWVLMTNDVLPGSRSQTWDNQKALVAKYRSQGYELPSCIDVAASLFLEYVQTEKRFYPDSPCTCTRCVELVSQKYPVVLGGFTAAGLDVTGNVCVNEAYGVGAVRKFC
jgi:hypothetical protein